VIKLSVTSVGPLVLALGVLTGSSGFGATRVVNDVTASVAEYYAPQRGVLADQPQETLVAEPAYPGGSARYATITLGTGADNRFTLALARQGDQCEIYVDANNDEDLTNDGDGKWQVDSQTSWQTTFTLRVPYSGPGPVVTRSDPWWSRVPKAPASGERTVPYRVVFYYFKDRLPEVVLYYRDSGFRTALHLGGQRRLAMLLDDNCNGRVDDLDATALFVDVDGDGKLWPGMSSHEYYGPGEPFTVGDQTYRLASAAPDASTVASKKTDHVPAKADLRPGQVLPGFQAVDTAGQPVSLGDFRGKVLLVDFWASWCVPCKAEMPNVIAAYQKYNDQGFEILGVSLDEARADMDGYLAEQPGMKWRQICDEKGWQAAIGQMYRVSSIPTSFLLDRQGRIVKIGLRGEDLSAAVEELVKQQ